MTTLQTLVPLFTAGIFFIGFLSLLGVVFNILLNPIKEQIQDLKESHKDLKASQDRLQKSQRDLQESQKEMNRKMDRLLAARQA